MDKLERPRLDLLRTRRDKSESKKVTNTYLKKLRLKGIFAGFSIAGLGIASCILMGIHTYKKISLKEKLSVEVKEYNELKKNYNKLLRQVDTIYITNKQISQGIIGVKSGSALLLEIQEILPSTIQLKKIKVNKNDLTLQGIAIQPYALDSINSLNLQISNSFLTKKKSTFLSRAWNSSEEINNTFNALEQKQRKLNVLNFTLETKLKNQDSDVLLANYERLGSFGLFKRVQLLKEEGLIK